MPEESKWNWPQMIGPLLGVLVGGLVAQFGAVSRQDFEREQYFLQQRIAAFQNYSRAYNAGMSILYDRIDQVIMDRGRVIALNSDFSPNRIDPIFIARSEALKKLTAAITLADADMQTQTVVVNALFEPDIQGIRFLKHIDDPTLGEATSTPREKFSVLLESQFALYQKDRREIETMFQANLKMLQDQLK